MMVVDIICTVIIALLLAGIGIFSYKRGKANKYANLTLWRNYWILYWGLVAVSTLCAVHNFIPF